MNSIINKNIYLTISLITLLLISSCHKEKNWIDDNTMPGNGSIPTISIINNNDTVLATNQNITFQAQFWSNESIKEIIIYETIEGENPSIIQTIPYSEASFSSYEGLDTLLINYIVPDGLTQGTKISIETEVVNATNGLTNSQTFYYRIGEPIPTISITNINMLSESLFDEAYEEEILNFEILINEDENTLFIQTDSLITYRSIDGTETKLSAISLPSRAASGSTKSTHHIIDQIPVGSEGKQITYSFEVKTNLATTNEVIKPIDIVLTPSLIESNPNNEINNINKVGFNLVNHKNQNNNTNNQDLFLSDDAITDEGVSLIAANTTLFIPSSINTYTTDNYVTIKNEFINNIEQSSSILNNIQIGNVYIARLRDTNEYVIIYIISILKSEDNSTASITFKYKHV